MRRAFYAVLKMPNKDIQVESRNFWSSFCRNYPLKKIKKTLYLIYQLGFSLINCTGGTSIWSCTQPMVSQGSTGCTSKIRDYFDLKFKFTKYLPICYSYPFNSHWAWIFARKLLTWQQFVLLCSNSVNEVCSLSHLSLPKKCSPLLSFISVLNMVEFRSLPWFSCSISAAILSKVSWSYLPVSWKIPVCLTNLIPSRREYP